MFYYVFNILLCIVIRFFRLKKLRKKYFLSFFDSWKKFWKFGSIKENLLSYTKWTININVFFAVNSKDYKLDLNNIDALKQLALETNWKRLKMVNDLFTSNVSNISNITQPHLIFKLNLGILVLKKWAKSYSTWVKNQIYMIKDINKILN